MPYFFAVIIIGFSLLSITQVLLLFNNNSYKAYGSLPDFNFAAAGDWGCRGSTTRTVNNILDKNPELVIGLGDYSYNNAGDCWFNITAPLQDRMKIAIGNHEDSYRGEENLLLLKEYMDHFNLTKQYYNFSHQNVHFTAISTELGDHGVQTEQYKFVNEDLANAWSDPNIDWIVVYHHKEAYTSPYARNEDTRTPAPRYDGLRDAYHPLYEKYGVDLVLQGHNHNYERSYPIKYNNANPSAPIITDTNNNTYSNPEGQIFATVGTGGIGSYLFLEKEPYMFCHYTGFGFLNIDVIDHGQTFNATFYSNDGTIKDQFSITKDGSASAADIDKMPSFEHTPISSSFVSSGSREIGPCN